MMKMTMTKKNQIRIESADNLINLVESVAHFPYKSIYITFNSP